MSSTGRVAEALPEGVHERLRDRYAVPPRHYHTLAHAAVVAGRAADLGGDRACLLAAWFHDAVYDATRTDNEARSAELLLDWLAGDPDAPEAARLVAVTAGHAPAMDDAQGAILCDADLAVLGGHAADYEAYRRAVRAEYAHVDDAGWRTGRSAVLRDLLSRPRIFRTPAAVSRWEAPARRNLRAELTAV